MDREAWWATTHGVTKENDRETKQQQNTETQCVKALINKITFSKSFI